MDEEGQQEDEENENDESKTEGLLQENKTMDESD